MIDEDSIDPASIRIGGRLRIQSIYYTFDNKYDNFRRKVWDSMMASYCQRNIKCKYLQFKLIVANASLSIE